MNRGTLQSFPVQQFMASDETNWWISNNTTDHPGDGRSTPHFSLPSLLPSYFFYHHQQPQNSPSSSTCNSSSFPLHAGWPGHQSSEQLPDSWRHLLTEGFVGEEEVLNLEQVKARKMMNWDESLHQSAGSTSNNISFADIKREFSSSNILGYHHLPEHYSPNTSIKQSWPGSSSSSCATNFLDGNCNHNIMEFASSTNKHHRSSDCCSNSNGGATKKARLHPSATQPAFKVRKEKLGDRINALHQLVSPFGKTDTASVLLEAIGYIRFLQNQIVALSSPYMGNESKQQQSCNEDVETIFSEEPGKDEERKRDLSSKGLCLVPVSCTVQMGSENGADYWAPALGRGFR